MAVGSCCFGIQPKQPLPPLTSTRTVRCASSGLSRPPASRTVTDDTGEDSVDRTRTGLLLPQTSLFLIDRLREEGGVNEQIQLKLCLLGYL